MLSQRLLLYFHLPIYEIKARIVMGSLAYVNILDPLSPSSLVSQNGPFYYFLYMWSVYFKTKKS